ncbi:ADP-ribosylation factor family protein [Onchocerca flexuosa]|uniref:ADP-ribosylation factor-related protein 1 n=1 Tax=Onchocerca flexuosa TaxID=387005 RepID=A0A238BP41_9BILA|nr:ADP-ribosylation factor family protein [Onchocerca flexuosa]
MYTLGVGIWQRLRRRSNYYIVIVGLDNAGKTTFLEQMKSRFIKNYQMLNPLKITSTVGLNIGTVVLGSLCLNFWDLGGQKELQSLWHKYFEDSQALIFVVDSCDPDRFPEVADVFKLVMNNEAVQKMPVLVACNKSDIEECMGTEIIRALMTDDRHIGDLALIPISALQGLNIERCVRWLCTVLTRNDSLIDLS